MARNVLSTTAGDRRGAGSIDDLVDLQQAHLTSQAAPIDGKWQAFPTMARHREIRSADQQAGYFCLNDEGQLCQFHVAPAYEPVATDLFAAAVARDEVKGAMVSTADLL